LYGIEETHFTSFLDGERQDQVILERLGDLVTLNSSGKRLATKVDGSYDLYRILIDDDTPAVTTYDDNETDCSLLSLSPTSSMCHPLCVKFWFFYSTFRAGARNNDLQLSERMMAIEAMRKRLKCSKSTDKYNRGAQYILCQLHLACSAGQLSSNSVEPNIIPSTPLNERYSTGVNLSRATNLSLQTMNYR